MCTTANDLLVVSYDTIPIDIKFENTDSTLSLIVSLTIYRTVMYDISGTILVEEERWVNTIDFRKIDRITSPLLRIF